MAERWYPGWGIALLRATVGIIFLVHGWDELFVGAAGAGFGESLVAERFPGVGALAWALAVTEFLGGLLLLFGWLTRWVAGVLFIEMLVVVFAVRVQHGFFVFRPTGQWGYEYDLLVLGALGCLVLAGGGKAALDDWLPPRRRRRPG